ncbi:hypothetical protein PIB30_113385, partial [Stylosanthes scabra]|nr:hypothetical protein [Stylosanthes scabra]
YPVHEAARVSERSAKLDRKTGGIIQIPLGVGNKSSPTVQTHEEGDRIQLVGRLRKGFPKLQKLPSSATNPSKAGRGTTLNNLFGRHRRSNRRSTSSGEREDTGAHLLYKQNPPRSRIEVSEVGKASVRPNHGGKKAPTILPGPPDSGENRPAAKANPPETRSGRKNASMVHRTVGIPHNLRRKNIHQRAGTGRLCGGVHPQTP